MACAPCSTDIDRGLPVLCTSLSHHPAWLAHIDQPTLGISYFYRPWPTHNFSYVGCGLPASTLVFIQRSTDINRGLHTLVCQRQSWMTNIVFILHTPVCRCQTWSGCIVHGLHTTIRDIRRCLTALLKLKIKFTIFNCEFSALILFFSLIFLFFIN